MTSSTSCRSLVGSANSVALQDRHGRIPQCDCLESHMELGNPSQGTVDFCLKRNIDDPSLSTMVDLDRVSSKGRCPYCGGKAYWAYPDKGSIDGFDRRLLKSLYVHNLKTGILRAGEYVKPQIFAVKGASELLRQGYLETPRKENFIGHLRTKEHLTERTLEVRLTVKGYKILNKYLGRS